MTAPTGPPARKVLDSAGHGWQNLSAAVYAEAPQAEAFETAALDDLLLVVVTSGTYRIESHDGRAWRGAHYHPGSVGVTAPQRTSVLRWRRAGPDPMTSLQIRLGRPLLEQAVQSLPRSPAGSAWPDTLELNDAFVSAAGRAVDGALRAKAPALYADSIAQSLAMHLVLATGHPAPSASNRGLSPAVLRRVIDHVHAHPAADLTVGELAAVAHLSPFHFLRMFRISTGTTPHRYVVGVRMNRAAHLLETTARPVAVIAAECGYLSARQFAAVFRQTYAASPTQYRALRRPV